MERVPSGNKKLDALLQGGFNKNSINLVAGTAGSGKSIFAVQFIVEGLRKGEAGIYITFEEKKQKVYEAMLEFGWDLATYEKQGKFQFLEYTPEQVKKVLVEGGGIVESIIEKMKAKRLVIDSITSFALLYEDELTKKEAALSLFELINKWDCTAVLTSQGAVTDESITAAMEFEVDGIIFLYHSKRKGIRNRALEVIKMRGTKIPNKTFPFEITRQGIALDTSKTVEF